MEVGGGVDILGSLLLHMYGYDINKAFLKGNGKLDIIYEKKDLERGGNIWLRRGNM